MLRLELRIPDQLATVSTVVTGPATFDRDGVIVGDVSLQIVISLCAWCGKPFVPCREKHRFCKDPNCRKTASRKRESTYEPETGG